MDDLVRSADQINRQLARYGVKFGIYKNGTFQERLFPFDAIPRVIVADTGAGTDTAGGCAELVSEGYLWGQTHFG